MGDSEQLTTLKDFDASSDLDPTCAVSQVQKWPGLSDVHKDKILPELLNTAEDPILALKLNPAWIAQLAPGEEIAFLDSIADYDMQQGVRRDDQSPGFLYHFPLSLTH